MQDLKLYNIDQCGYCALVRDVLEELGLEYKKIDDLLFEVLVERHEEGRPEKMVEYLKLRKEIKDKHPLED